LFSLKCDKNKTADFRISSTNSHRCCIIYINMTYSLPQLLFPLIKASCKGLACHNSGHHPVGVVTVLDEGNPNIYIITSPRTPILGTKFSSRNTTIVYTDGGLMLQHDYFLMTMSHDSNRTFKWK